MSDAAFHPLRLRSVVPETDSAICLEFDVPSALAGTFRFRPGQYLTLRSMHSGAEVRRCYSICSGLDDASLRVAVKRIEGGVFSAWAHAELRAGDLLEVSPPQGNFTVDPEPSQARRYLCIAAGSGITPVLSIVKSLLSREPLSEVTLIYGNQRSASIMFREELSFLKSRHLGRFNWINILSREEQDAEVLNGRIDNRKGAELERKHLIRIREMDAFFLCGPEGMISEVSRGLRGAGVPESRIHYELFYSNPEDAQQVILRHHARAERFGGRVSEVVVTLDGRSSRFPLAADGENILDAAMSAGVDVPYSCKGGVCATCKARVLEGEVEMDLNHALGEADVAAGYVLTCQAHPVSERVVLDFDQV
jgi:ring-1,2-phenylacetyl-CoA epoxidase subunit PaaE